ncbi:reverse transcriptase domain-containing protein [Tanacetum coccineum]
MMAIFHDMVEDFMEVFIDDFLVFGNSFDYCLANLDRMLARCEETNLVLNWEKYHFMIKEGIVLGHKTSGAGIEVDRAKIDVIAKLPYPTNVKGVRSFLGHAGFYRRISPDWNVPFELMCDASDFAVGAVLGQRIHGKFKPIYYASKTLNNAQEHYTTTEKELLAVVFSFDKFRQYLILSKTVVYTNHSALKYLFSKEDIKPRLIRLENPDLGTFTKEEITDEFPDEHLSILKAELNSDEPWYVDYVNYIVGKIVPPNWTLEKRRRFFSQVKNYFWDEPYAFKLCPDNVIRRCVAGNKILKILAHCHSGPIGGHHSVLITRRKVYESGFYWPSIIKDAKDYVMRCDACQRSGNISSRKRSLGYKPKNWSKKLDDALWAFRTAYKTPTRCTPFRLVYGKACYLPMEIKHKAYLALKQCNMVLTAATKNRFMELNELIELRDGAYENTHIYKERTKRWHDSRLRGDKNFKAGDNVLLFNSRFKMHPGKLKSKWYGPNVVKTVYPYRTVEIIDKNGIGFKVNGQRLKKYHDGHIDVEEKEVVKLDDDTT